MLLVLFSFGLILQTQSKLTVPPKNDTTDEKETYPNKVGDTSFGNWEDVYEASVSRGLLSYLKKYPKLATAIQGATVVRLANAFEDGNTLILMEVGNNYIQIKTPKKKYIYPMLYVDPKKGSLFKSGQLARVLEDKPFESEE
ncbi:hypothetical protein RF11_09129 [Thelohanellus kitauei]|uniref:Uncharacterized protein n=1 Tax=Thelohanellus kitauei TaxID=669202 RepID=A0A0C2M185_THEKT|nr:hypothetical protein RF11_09129 [Thelohanellus kitauei]